MPNSAPPLYLLAGPTASGKSAKAIAWAETTGGIILNADSMQLYADAPTLTARPDATDQAKAPHVLYGHLSGDQLWSTGEWLRAARPYIADALNGGPKLCIVGGTGLYFNSLIKGLAEIPEIEPSVRTTARRTYIEQREDAFRALLARVDPASVVRIMPNDQQRLTRAYEVWLQTGVSLTDWQRRTVAELDPGTYHFECLYPDRDWLYERCDHRLRLMLDGGALDEVAALAKNGLQPDWPIMRVLGLSECVAYLNGEISRDAALSLAQQKTRNYAKRQMTWFRNQFAAT